MRAVLPQAEFRERLRSRREDLLAAALTRVYAVSDPTDAQDPTYIEGLRAAVCAAVDYALESIEASTRNPPQIPPVLLIQARIAARDGIGLDTVLRRYFAGYALLGDLMTEEADASGLDAASFKALMGTMASRFDGLLAAVSEEHARESERCPKTTEEHRAELVEGLLAGERLDASELAYELDGSHLALVGKGPGVLDAIREIASSLDRRLLMICREEETAWAWLGGRRPTNHRALQVAVTTLPSSIYLTVGESAEGVEGWRLSHRQAKAALPVALRGSQRFVRYANVALLAAAFKDDLFATSLREIYLKPLVKERDHGRISSETLRAYFSSGRSISLTASVLGVNRNTVTNRLRLIEDTIGRPFTDCEAEINAALQLDQLDLQPGAFY